MSGGGRLARDADAASVARSILGRLDGTGEGLERAMAVTAWREAAGPEVASHARGFTLREGELVVSVDSNTWATELAAMAEQYRGAVNECLGKEAVRSIRFTVSKAVAEERWWEAVDALAADDGAADKVEPVRATENECEQVRMMAAAVHDEKVREAVVAAAIRHLEWRKGLEAANATQGAAERAGGAEPGPEH